MTSHVRHRRQLTGGAALPLLPLEPGELALNLGDLQVFSSVSGSPLPMLGVRNWAATAVYAIGDIVASAGKIYVCKTANGPNAFNAAHWNAFTLDVGAAATYLPLAGGVMTGVLALALGTAPLPGLAFTGDPNTGLYSPGADQVGWATNGVARGSLDADGIWRLAAPTGSPTMPTLLVSATTANIAGVRILSQAAGDAILMLTASAVRNWSLRANSAPDLLALRDESRAVNVLTFSNAGNAVIPIPTGGNTLSVTAKGGGFGVAISSEAAALPALISFSETGVRQWYMGAGINATNSFALADNTRGAYVLTINQFGNVVINASASGTPFAVSGDVSALNYVIGGQLTSNAGTIGFYNGNGPGLAMYGTAAGGGSAGSMQFAGGFFQFNPTNANGVRFNLAASGYAQVISGGTSLGYIGSNALVAGVAATDLVVRAEANLYFVAGAVQKAALFSDGTFSAALVRASIGATAGNAALKPADATHSGYLELNSAPGVRIGYIGYATGSVTDAGALAYIGGSHNFTGQVIVPYAGAGVNDNQAANTSWVNAATVGGAARSWGDYKAARNFAQDYPAPNYPIMLNIIAGLNTVGAQVSVLVGGGIIAQTNTQTAFTQKTLSVVIPPSATYRVNITGTVSKDAWNELR